MAIQLITNSKIVDKIAVGDEIDVRSIDGKVTLTATEVDDKKAKLVHGSFVAFLRKENDGWYYDHTLNYVVRERRIRGIKIVDETTKTV